jgi:hypothetical protein
MAKRNEGLLAGPFRRFGSADRGVDRSAASARHIIEGVPRYYFC